MKADRFEYVLGKTTVGQNVTLTGERQVDGRVIWYLTKHALNQRDDTVVTRNITTEMLKRISEHFADWKE